MAERLLTNPDEAIRLDVVKAVSEVGAPAYELLKTSMSDGSHKVRTAAAVGLGKTRKIEAQALLVDTLRKDPDNGVRMASAEALGDLGDASVREILHEALSDKYLIVKIGAATSLARLGDKDMVPRLYEIWESSDPALFSLFIVGAYGKLEDPAAIPYLEKIIARYKELPSAADDPNLHRFSVILEHLREMKKGDS
jgi:HEAT repeat protein